MRTSFVLVAVFASSTLAFPQLSKPKARQTDDSKSTLRPEHTDWLAPGPNDVRSPCPMLNTLCNHGFLPQSGRNISLEIFTVAIKDALNIGPSIADSLFAPALDANPEINAKTIDLDMLYVHNFIERDGSMSRQDSALDSSGKFSAETFDEYLSYYKDATEITIKTAADARARHALAMSKTTPNFSLTRDLLKLPLGETSLMLWAWNQNGTLAEPVANRAWFEYFFREEKFPVEIGWAPAKTELNITSLGAILTKLTAATPAGVPLAFNPGHSK